MDQERDIQAVFEALKSRPKTGHFGRGVARTIVSDLYERGFVLVRIEDHLSLTDAAVLRMREQGK